MEYSSHCEHYINYCMDLVPYDDPNYVAKVFDMSIGLYEAEIHPDPNLIEICKYHDELLEKGLIDN